MIPDIEPANAWKKQPYVWMIIFIPLSAIIVGFIMLALAIESDSGLVADDYYKKGKEINRVLARDNMAQSMGLKANLVLTTETGKLLVKIHKNINIEIADLISINFFHATRQGLDQTQSLRLIKDDVYSARIEGLPPGRWNVQIGTDSWRILGSLTTPGETAIWLIPSSN